MATPPFMVEDQTDEDFFDKLIDDDFCIAGSRPGPAIIARSFSNTSIGDEGAQPENSVDAGFAAKEEDDLENRIMQSLETFPKDTALSEALESVGHEENTAEVGLIAQDKEVSSRGSMETTTGSVSSGSLIGKIDESKGASVKEVQWSAFNSDPQQFYSDGFGSYSDFLSENLDGSASNPKAKDNHNSNLGGDPVTDLGTDIGSFKQQDAQFYGSTGEQVTDANDSQYSENLYPGWKFDSSTGQWYQIEDYTTSMNSQSDNYNVTTGIPQESFQETVSGAGYGFNSDKSSEIAYFQQSAKLVSGTVAKDCVTNNVFNWNQVSQGSTQYPPNMVFDPQYPEWYYDTNTQQWHTLDSYNQTVQRTSNIIQEQFSQDVNASNGFTSKEDTSLYNEAGQFEQNTIQDQSNQDLGGYWSTSNYVQQNMRQPEPIARSVASFSVNQQMGNFNGSMGHVVNYTDQQNGLDTLTPFSDHDYRSGKDLTGIQRSVPEESMYQYTRAKVEQSQQGHLSHSYYDNQNSIKYPQKPFQSTSAYPSQFSYAHNEGRSSAGRPPHALVSFGFGGKIIVMKEAGSFGTKLDYGSQDTVGGSISILSLMEVVMDKIDNPGVTTGDCGYFHALCQQTFPGPLVGGNAATKDVNKWIDEKITNCESLVMDFRKGELLRLLLSLLKISCQHYGKLQSPFGAEPSLEETDGPESAVTKLFASARKNGAQLREYGSFIHCMHNLPSEGQIQTTAVEVQNLLVSGRRKDALHCAQAGQLWGPALVLAAQLGQEFYADTVKQMAQRQIISGSPLRTICLLIAGQPADVFSADNSTRSSLSGAVNGSQQPTETLVNGMLDDWKENLAIITANRTKDDELVIVHLGDCLWKERGEVTAAHSCYLVAEANFESYSESARLCLIGADHWRCPRTYASPEAIQTTELYEYSKVLGNSQFILLPLQPYKLIYAYMLAEVGKVSDSLRYCQASLKLLKNSGRTPEVEMLKSLLTSLEERLRTHQQGGYSTNLAPAKLVGKLFTSIDKSIHRMMGAPPSSLPPVPQSSVNGKESYSVVPKVASSQSTMAMSSLIPSPSVETTSEWQGDGSMKSMHSRSISEPVFGGSQDPLKDSRSRDAQSKTSLSGGPSRLGRIGSQLFQKTVGWVSRSHPDHQAKLGEKNKFYYDEKLKRWVEEGAEPPAEEAALPPPPTMASFQNGTSDYNMNSAFKSQSLIANGELQRKSPTRPEHSSGIPPISPNPNPFYAHGGARVRSRYVDTFNKGVGAPRNSFQPPSAPSVKPLVGTKFFVPTTTPAASDEQIADATRETIPEAIGNGETSTSVAKEASFSSRQPTIQRHPSMDSITFSANKGQLRTSPQNGNDSLSRALSWSGSYEGMFDSRANEVAKPLGDGPGLSSRLIPTNGANLQAGTSPLQLNDASLGDDLHEVEL